MSATAAIATKIIKRKVLDKALDTYSSASTETKVFIFTALAIIVLLPLLTILVGYLGIVGLASTFHSDLDKLAGAPTSYGLHATGEYFSIYQQAQERYNVSWAVLAAIAEKESTNGTYPMGIVSQAGAVGFMQFMPGTWSGWENPKGIKNSSSIIAAMSPYNKDNLPAPNVPGLPYDTDPASIAEYGGYGTDGDGDGYADPFNPVDAIFSAAKMLQANLRDGQYEKALSVYCNGDRNYIMAVLARADAMCEFQMPSSDGLWPCDPQWPISAEFGRTGPLWRNGHTGIDIGCPEGSLVYAAFDGKVIFVGPAGEYGGSIVLTDGKGTKVRYAHLSTLGVQHGQYINQGEVIGFSGNTGKSTGPHLHFEVEVNGQLCNPTTWLKSPGTPGKENY